MTAPALVRRGKGRQPKAIEDLRDRRDELAAHTEAALAFVDATRPKARRLALALEAILLDDPRATPVLRMLLNLAGGIVADLDLYERRHLPEDPDPAMAVAA